MGSPSWWLEMGLLTLPGAWSSSLAEWPEKGKVSQQAWNSSFPFFGSRAWWPGLLAMVSSLAGWPSLAARLINNSLKFGSLKFGKQAKLGSLARLGFSPTHLLLCNAAIPNLETTTKFRFKVFFTIHAWAWTQDVFYCTSSHVWAPTKHLKNAQT